MERLTADLCRERAAAHRARVSPWVAPRLERRREGRSHPVDDFLFDYYNYRPGQLLRWHPGAGAAVPALEPEILRHRGYAPRGGWVSVDPAAVGRQVGMVDQVLRLLRATARRPAAIGCSALHEWAMVYGAADERRHRGWPLRLPAEQVDGVVAAVGLSCTHFDAFRFFTGAARPLNPWQLSRSDQQEFEQPGCLHATMDLYKWAYRLDPLLPAETVADCFELARSCRELDMRASPYDLAGLGLDPVRVETPSGREEFATEQASLARRGSQLRARLIAEIEDALAALASMGAPATDRTRAAAPTVGCRPERASGTGVSAAHGGGAAPPGSAHGRDPRMPAAPPAPRGPTGVPAASQSRGRGAHALLGGPSAAPASQRQGCHGKPMGRLLR